MTDPLQINVWSFENGRLATTCPRERNASSIAYLGFRGPTELVAVFHGLVEQWSIPEGKLLQDFVIQGMSSARGTVALSPGGRYLAVLGKYLAVYDFQDGSLVGATPLPNHTEMADCQPFDVAFSPNGRGIAGMYEEGDQSHLVCWRTDSAQVIAHHQIGQRWLELVPGLNSYGNGIQWLGDMRGWLLGGQVMVERDSGQVRWRLPRPHTSRHLVDGKNLLWSFGAGFEDYLVCNSISLEQCFDAELRKQQVGPRNPFPGMSLAALVRLQIKSYPPTGDPAVIAKRVLAPIGWAASDAIAIDKERDVLIIGVGVMMVNTQPAKEALEQAGFRIGGAMISPL